MPVAKMVQPNSDSASKWESEVWRTLQVQLSSESTSQRFRVLHGSFHHNTSTNHHYNSHSHYTNNSKNVHRDNSRNYKGYHNHRYSFAFIYVFILLPLFFIDSKSTEKTKPKKKVSRKDEERLGKARQGKISKKVKKLTKFVYPKK